MDLTLLTGGLTAVWMMIATAVDMVPLVAADDDGSLGHYPGSTLQALDFTTRLSETIGDVATGPRGLLLVAVALLTLRTRMLPRWTGWFAMFVGGASLVGVLSATWPVAPFVVAWFVGLFGFLLWTLVVTVTCGIRAVRGRA